MLDKATITQKTNELLAELRVNAEEENFKQGYFKDLECVLQDTGIIKR